MTAPISSKRIERICRPRPAIVVLGGWLRPLVAGWALRLRQDRRYVRQALSLEELGLHGWCGVDAHQPCPPGAEVSEAVRDAGRADDDVAGPALDGLIADPDKDVAFQDDESLVVGVVVQLGSLAGLVVHEEERHRRGAVPAALEGAGDVIARQVVGVHVVHGQRCLSVRGLVRFLAQCVGWRAWFTSRATAQASATGPTCPSLSGLLTERIV
jgi:hypothetical protein